MNGICSPSRYIM